MVEFFFELLFICFRLPFEGIVKAPANRTGCVLSVAALTFFAIGILLFVAAALVGESQWVANPRWWSGTLFTLSLLSGLLYMAFGIAGLWSARHVRSAAKSGDTPSSN